jgi:hypothetical protein
VGIHTEEKYGKKKEKYGACPCKDTVRILARHKPDPGLIFSSNA